MDIELDLDGAIRPGLDILGNEIIIALKKRSRFKQNLEVYRPGLVLDHPELSLLEYELRRVEEVHAELGRYAYASQESFTELGPVKPIIKRPPPENPVQDIPSRVGGQIIQYYLGWIEECLEAGSDSDTFGETVTADVAALQGISERVNVGKYVAEYKFQQNPQAFRQAQGDPGALRRLVVNEEREKRVIDVGRQLAEHYGFDAEQACRIFRWKIQLTTDLEINYLQKRIEREA